MNNKTTRTAYELEYCTSINNHIKTVELKWTIFNIHNQVPGSFTFGPVPTHREYTNNTNDYSDDFDADSKILLKVRMPTHSTTQSPEIFYASPVPLQMQARCESPSTVFVTGLQDVQAKVWQRMLFQQNTSNMLSLGRGTLFLFKFTINIKNYRSKDIAVPQPQLHNDLENLLNNTNYSDVTIKSIEGVEFHAYKGVLSVRSDVFKAYFEHNTIEALTDTVESPFDAEVLRQVLTFIYTDKAPEMANMPKKLLAAADYYQMQRLKKLCENTLQKNLTVENAIEMFELADLHSANDLKKVTLEFINPKRAKSLIKTTSWKKLQSTEVMKSIFEHVMSNVNV